uniref:Protogenin n=1 Tax=Leptobrachium leishanense TaxID=445787 RepID=A0A8C5PBB3_9ANUR
MATGRRSAPGGMLLLWAALLCFPGSWCFSELLFVKGPQDVIVTRRESVVLDCQAHGDAPVTVRWMKNGVKVPENDRISTLHNGSLYICEVGGRKGEQSDEGFYQCLALYKYGAILSQRAHLSIAKTTAAARNFQKSLNEHLSSFNTSYGNWRWWPQLRCY